VTQFIVVDELLENHEEKVYAPTGVSEIVMLEPASNQLVPEGEVVALPAGLAASVTWYCELKPVARESGPSTLMLPPALVGAHWQPEPQETAGRE